MASLVLELTNPSHGGRGINFPLCGYFSCEIFLVSWTQSNLYIYIYISVSPIDIGDSYLLRSRFQVCVWKSVVCTPNTSSWDSNVVNNGKTLRAASNAHLFHNCGSINIVSLDLSSFPWTPLHLGLCCSKLPFLPEDHRLFLFPQCSWRELRGEGKRPPWLHTIPGAANS